MKTENSFETSNTCKPYMRFMFAVAMCAASLFAAPAQNFATDVEAYLAAHKIAGVESFQGLLKVMGEPCGAAASVDATVLPKHKARKVRLWGVQTLSVYKSWGLDVAEFDPETLRSRLVPGLYACGEVLDVDGDCGGFNLQWAWASGLTAGELR